MRTATSPPSRAAWIETSGDSGISASAGASPPSRAAWIEISTTATGCEAQHGRRLHGRRGLKYAALVGKNRKNSRRLHGRRGLKCHAGSVHSSADTSPPSRAAWIEIRAAEDAVIKEDVAAFTGGVD